MQIPATVTRHLTHCWQTGIMKRFEAFFNDTWWLWLVLGGFGLVMAAFVHWSFMSVFPISGFTFFYFMYMRYDEDGNIKEGL